MNWLPFIGTVGIGVIIAKVLDIFLLQRMIQRHERQKWLRDQRLRVYSSLAKELMSQGLWFGATTEREAIALVAEATLLSTDSRLLACIEGFLPDVIETRQRLDAFTNNGTSTIEERTDMHEREVNRIKEKTHLIVAALRASLVND